MRKKPELLFFIAVVGGMIVGKLIRNFNVGLLLGIILGALMAFLSRPSKKNSLPANHGKN